MNRYLIYNYQNRTYFTEEGTWTALEVEAKAWPTRESAASIARLFQQTQEPVRVEEQEEPAIA